MKQLTTLVEIRESNLSDAGSTPAISTKKTAINDELDGGFYVKWKDLWISNIKNIIQIFFANGWDAEFKCFI